MFKKMCFTLVVLLIFNIQSLYSNESSDFAVAGCIKFNKTKYNDLVKVDLSLAKLNYSKKEDACNVTFLIHAKGFVLAPDIKLFFITSTLAEDNVNKSLRILCPNVKTPDKVMKYHKKYMAEQKKQEKQLRQKVINNNFKAVKNNISLLFTKGQMVNIKGSFLCDDTIYQIDVNQKIEYGKDLLFVCYAPKSLAENKILESIKNKESTINYKPAMFNRYNFEGVKNKVANKNSINLDLDYKSLVQLAEIYLLKMYGKEVLNQKPWIILDYGDKVKVEGFSDDKELSGGSSVILRKSDGKVISITKK